VNSKGKIAAIGLGAVALGGIVGVGVSFADDPTPSTSPSASPSAGASAKPGSDKNAGHDRRALVRRALHGEATLGGKQIRVVDFQRGLVGQVSDTSITLKSTDGFTATYAVTSDTKVRKDGQAAKITDIKTGDEVRVLALKTGTTSTAKVVAEPKPH
jgi:hypothetical protein